MRRFVLAVCLAGLIAPVSFGAIYTWNLDTEFSGSGTPTSGPLVATVEDAVADTVRITMSAELLTSPDEFVVGWYWNVLGGPPTTWTIWLDSGQGASNISVASNAFKADGDGFFDILFEWGNRNSGTAFTAGEKSVWFMTAPGLSASLFDALSAPGGGASPGPFPVVARVQGTGPDGGGSAWMSTGDGGGPPNVPEPGSLAALALGLFGVGYSVYRRRAG